MGILHAAVLPLASAEAQRDREAELIFRGIQYAEGIRLFRRRFGRYPVSLQELIETKPRSLRKLWKDPMTDSNDWGILTAGSPLSGVPGAGGAGDKSGRGPRPLPTPTPRPAGGLGGPAGGGVLGPITGVHSKSTKRGFRLFEGRDVYSEWRFTEQTLVNRGGPGGGGSETPGGLPGPGIGGGGPTGGGRKK